MTRQSPAARPDDAPAQASARLLVDPNPAGRAYVETLAATPAQRPHLVPIRRFLRAGPKPPPPERVELVIERPEILALAVQGKLRGTTLEAVERAAGLHVFFPYDRRQAQGSPTEWVALLRDRLRSRLAPL